MYSKQYMKKKPQNKSYSPTMQNPSFGLSYDSDSNEIGTMYEQIKSEVVTSVLNWLTMYLAAEQEDKRVNEKYSGARHCCECTIKKRSSGSMRSSFSSPFSANLDQSKVNDANVDQSLEMTDSTTNTDRLITEPASSYVECDLMQRDANMVLTEYKASQVWPEWCQHLDRRADDKKPTKAAANSPVYFDYVNNRLCVYRRGLVEYPSIVPQSPKFEKQNLQSIPEIRESLLKQSLVNNFVDDQNNEIGKKVIADTCREDSANWESVQNIKIDN